MTSSPLTSLLRPSVQELPPYNAGLSNAAVQKRYGVERISRLGSNENPYGPSPAVHAALAHLADQIWTYPDPSGSALRQAIGERLAFDASRIMLGNGSENLLEILSLAFLQPGDRVVTQTPSFGLHVIYPRMMDAVVDLLPLRGDLHYDIPAWERAARSAPKMLILCNPSNPVGCQYDRDDLQRILDATPPTTLLVLDEAYYEYATHDPNYPDVLTLLQAHNGPWVLLRTFSKAWGLAGLRIGYGLCSETAFSEAANRVRTPFNINQAAQLAALAAWNDPAHMAKAAAATVSERERMRQVLQSFGFAHLRVAPSSANFLWLDLGTPNPPVYEALLQQGIITKAWKDPGFETCLRVSVGLPAENDLFLHTLRETLSASAAT